MQPIARSPYSPVTRAKLGAIAVLIAVFGALTFSGLPTAHAQESYIQLSAFDDLAESLSSRDQQRRAMIDEFVPDEADALGRLVSRLVTSLTQDLDAVFVGVEELTRQLGELQALAQQAQASADRREREANVLFDEANSASARASVLQRDLTERLRAGLDRSSLEAISALGELNRTRLRAEGARYRAQLYQAHVTGLRQSSDLRDMIRGVAERREGLLNLEAQLEEQAQTLVVSAELGAEVLVIEGQIRGAQAAIDGFVANAAAIERDLRDRGIAIQTLIDEHLPEGTPDAPRMRDLTFDDLLAEPAASAPAPAAGL